MDMTILSEVAHYLYGDAADELIAKASPDQADLNTGERRKARIGLASNVVGIGAGAAALKPAVDEARNKFRVARGQEPVARTAGRLSRLIDKNPKVAAGVAAGAVGLQVGALGGDFVANRVLHHAAKGDPRMKGGLRALGEQVAPNTTKKVKNTVTKPFGKNFKPVERDIVFEGEFSKVDTDKRQVFGWASIVKKNGEDVVDLQGDYISIDEIEKAAYDYVIKSRKGGNQHERAGEAPLHVSDMIESFIVTPEKIEKMGLPEDTPLGWWVGFKVNDDKTWEQVKSGERAGFSIHGRGSRS